MARLAKANITTPNSAVLAYTVPANKVATVQINACNRASTQAGISIAITVGASPQDDDWFDFEHPLGGKCSYERAPQRLEGGERIYVMSTATQVGFQVTGELMDPEV